MATQKDGSARKWVAFVAGKLNIQKGLLASFLEREFGFFCQVADDDRDLPVSGLAENRSLLLIRDCSADSADDIKTYLDMFGERLLTDDQLFLVLVNLRSELGIEAEMLHRGVRGVINTSVSPNVLLRFVNAVIGGELWFPRQLVSRCILESRGQLPGPVFNEEEAEVREDELLSVNLTEREREVLVEIGIGSTNDQIADRLCISQHTVKSHIYRIFRKINVPNRLQAALWASKYMA
ncbi:MAG: response regulator transcription factor [Deltaproteobacteria bacterium]|nr:response regulator transcription factor [Deltaproteobacteria bacterium]